MKRLTQEQLGIMGCYGNMTKEEMLAEINRGLDLIEEAEILELVHELADMLKDCDAQEFKLWVRLALEAYMADDEEEIA